MKLGESGGELATQSILEQISALGGRVELAGENLRCHVPLGALPEALAERIRANKQALVAQLRHVSRSQARPPFMPGHGEGAAGKLSSAQRVWFYEAPHPADHFYLLSLALRLRGPLDAGALSQAWRDLTARHAALRTRFAVEEDEPYQVVEPAVEPDFRVLDHAGAEGDLIEHLSRLANEPLDLSKAPLARMTVLRLSDLDHALQLSIHHIVADGWSMGLLVQELLEAYRARKNGRRPNLPVLGASYLDYARWQQDYLGCAACDEDVTYWTRKLAGAPERLPAPGFDPVATKAEPHTSRERLVLPRELHAALAAWAQERGGTVYSVMLTALYALLHLWTDAADIVIGSVVAGRQHPELDAVVGCFINSVPLRCGVEADGGFAALHERVRAELLGAWEHQACPFEKVVEALNPQRAGGRTPLFNIAFQLQNYPHLDTGDVEFAAEIIALPPRGLGMDLRWVAGEANGEFVLACEYDERFAAGQAVRSLLAAYQALLRHALSHPEQALVDYRENGALAILPRTQRLVIAATFAAEPVREPLQFWIRSLALPYSVRLAPHAQLVRSLLDPAGELRRHGDLGSVLVRLEDWLGADAAPGALEARLDEFLRACETCRAASRRPITVWSCPVSAKAARQPPLSARLAEAENALVLRCEALGIRALRAQAILEKYPVAKIDDEHLAERGPMSYSSEAFIALGTMLARELAARERPPLKAVVLDADNSLWRGACGEDGPAHVVLDAPALALQRFFLDLRRQGVALCLCSKNAEAGVRAAFAAHPQMPLRWEDFSVRKIDWQPKSRNLEDIAAALNIGLDAMALVDDDPAECAEVEAQCPGALVFCLPEKRLETHEFLHGIWEFDLPYVETPRDTQ